VCDTRSEAETCEVCRLFGSTGREGGADNVPARLLVRDGGLTPEGEKFLRPEGIPTTEAKSENAIDRMTSAATPRTIERVPAGAQFRFELTYVVNDKDYPKDLENVRTALQLVEAEGLGGMVSRGSGNVKFWIDRFETKLDKDAPIEAKVQELFAAFIRPAKVATKA
jgi:CRISPR-associated protein Csm3